MGRFSLYVFISLICLINALPFKRRCLNNQFECKNGVCINKNYWCKRSKYCGDGSENINCYKYYPNCASDQTFCVKDRKCIPLKWACDGYNDCSDNSDERHCLKDGFRIQDIPGVRQSREKGRLWLIKQQKTDWSWGKDSNRAIISLRLSDDMDFNLTNITTQLMSKQLKLQLSEILLRDRNSVKAYEIALYIHSLLAICSNPRNFQGIDLVKLLEEKIDESESINPITALAICNSNKTLSSKQILKLRNIFWLEESMPHKLDSLAYILMAITCLKHITISYQDNLNTTESKSDNFGYSVFNKTKQEITKLQNDDGSFGNVYSTALLIHALLSIDNETSNENQWNVTNAFNYLISQQNQNGSFGDILATYLILPIMNGKTFIDLRSLSCNLTKTENQTIQEDRDNKKIGKHRIYYNIFVGQDKDIAFSISLNVPTNSTFYDVMHLAAKWDYKFRFKYVDYPWGKYVYFIFGIINNPEEGNYWLLYKVSGNTTYLQKPPDKVIPKEKETYIYWYRSTNF